MAKSTYLQLCQQLRRELGESGTGPSSVLSQTGIYDKIVHWVKEADYAIQTTYFDWKFLYDTTTFSTPTIAGTKEYTAPTDLGVWDHDTFYLDYTSSTYAKLEYVDYMTYVKTLGMGSLTNRKPSLFTIIPKTGHVILHNPPDAVYTLTANYWATPTKLAQNTDESAIPENYERVIIARAKMYYAEEQEFPALYQQAAQEYNEQLMRLESHELPEQEGRFRGGSGLEIVVRPE